MSTYLLTSQGSWVYQASEYLRLFWCLIKKEGHLTWRRRKHSSMKWKPKKIKQKRHENVRKDYTSKNVSHTCFNASLDFISSSYMPFLGKLPFLSISVFVIIRRRRPGLAKEEFEASECGGGGGGSGGVKALLSLVAITQYKLLRPRVESSKRRSHQILWQAKKMETSPTRQATHNWFKAGRSSCKMPN